MKDLDETQVYDLRGISLEQSKELYRWLRVNDEGWDCYGSDIIFHESCLRNETLGYVSDVEWVFASHNVPPTQHIIQRFSSISTTSNKELFYENDLEYARERLEHYQREVDRLEQDHKPKANDVCKFWDDSESKYVIGILKRIDEQDTNYPYQSHSGLYYTNSKKLTEQEVINLLFNK